MRSDKIAPSLAQGAVLLLSSLALSACTTGNFRPAAAAATPQATLVAPGAAFAVAQQVAARHEGDFALQGSGESMAPVYRSGTAIVVHPTSFFMLRRGMPVVYLNRRGAPVAHVLVEKADRGWVVMGINNGEADDDLVTPANLVGVIRSAFASADQVGGSVARLDSAPSAAGGGVDSQVTLLH